MILQVVKPAIFCGLNAVLVANNALVTDEREALRATRLFDVRIEREERLFDLLVRTDDTLVVTASRGAVTEEDLLAASRALGEEPAQDSAR